MARYQNQPNIEKRSIVLSLRQSGMTYRQIANEIGLKTDSWVTLVCRENGLGGTSVWKEKRYEEMRKYKAQGHTAKETAEQFGVSEATAAKVCKGVSPQRPDYADLSFRNAQKEESAKSKIEKANPDVEYLSGYKNSDSVVHLRCRICGNEFYRLYDKAYRQHIRCDNCYQESVARNKAAKENESAEKASAREASRKAIAEKKAKAEQDRMKNKVCPICGKAFSTTKWNQMCCSLECSKTRDNRRHDRRISKDKRVDNGISARSLYKRDKGICWICGGMCDLNDYVMDDGYFIAGDWYPSVDHIKPIYQGGEDSWSNVKLAHRICNLHRYHVENRAPVN